MKLRSLFGINALCFMLWGCAESTGSLQYTPELAKSPEYQMLSEEVYWGTMAAMLADTCPLITLSGTEDDIGRAIAIRLLQEDFDMELVSAMTESSAVETRIVTEAATRIVADPSMNNAGAACIRARKEMAKNSRIGAYLKNA